MNLPFVSHPNRSYSHIFVAVGAKQIIVDPRYLESLGRPNVELQNEPIDCLVENGIKLKSGEIVQVDAIVFATGYSLVRIFGLAKMLFNPSIRNLRIFTFVVSTAEPFENTLTRKVVRPPIWAVTSRVSRTCAISLVCSLDCLPTVS